MVSLPRIASSPFKELGRRALLALLLLFTTTMLVWLDRDAYVDNTGGDGPGNPAFHGGTQGWVGEGGLASSPWSRVSTWLAM